MKFNEYCSAVCICASINSYVMAQIRVHDDHKIPASRFHAMHVSGAQTQFGSARSQDDHILTVDLLQFGGDVQCAVRTAVVDDDDLEVQFAAARWEK